LRSRSKKRGAIKTREGGKKGGGGSMGGGQWTAKRGGGKTDGLQKKKAGHVKVVEKSPRTRERGGFTYSDPVP